MSKLITWRHLVTILAMLAMCAVAYAFEPPTQEGVGAWFSIMPPLLAIGLVLLTRRLLLSMTIGITVGGLLAAGVAHDGIWTVTTTGVGSAYGYFHSAVTDSWNLQVLAFIPFMLVMIAIMIVGGGFQALVNVFAKMSFGRRATQVKTILAGLVLFFDDYANTMVVGSGMRPITDKQKISRAKLAFLVDATSAPIAGLAIMSTWIGYEIGLFKEVAGTLGIDRDGFSMFLDAIGFRFYCLLMIAFVFINAISGRDFGPMLTAERSLEKADDIDTSAVGEQVAPAKEAVHSLATLFIPLGVLFAILLVGFWRDGGGMALIADSIAPLFSLGAWQDVLMKVENSITVLMWSAIGGFVAASLVALAHARISLTSIGKATLHGLKLAVVPMAILCLAWSLKGACDALGTGKFLVAAIGDAFPAMLFPAVLFITAGLTAFATGTSWGTMAILIPTAIPVAFALDGSEYALITIMSLAAVLDGAILGDHCSPISDTTIMSSTASGCHHMEHVRTQLPYALTVGLIAIAVGYIPVAAGAPTLWPVALLLIIGVHYLFGEKREDAPGRSVFARYIGWASDTASVKAGEKNESGTVNRGRSPASR